MTLGERIRAWRTERGVSQVSLAEQAGVRQGTLSEWEADKSAPHIGKVGALARAMGVSLDWLLTGDGEGPVTPVAAEPAAPPAEAS